ncbi:MAG TPA: PPK2 family polyphosphate kinase [Nevskia sp.]|jgi:PPK2 family polyphosphate:nucleotide phosphotransferase|nr:PPK2 family polyphosphate kinase [Nevskia sp.]
MAKDKADKNLFKAVDSPWRVDYDGGFKVARARTTPPRGAPDKAGNKKALDELTARLDRLQHILYAHDHRSLLLIFQAMDAAGKDSTIRAVLSGINPAGCQVHAFKQPSVEELDHDFLWRSAVRLPERGRIGVFNRSYYEEVLIVKVHPSILERQKLPAMVDRQLLWKHRYSSIRHHEKHLARNGTVILKFWLNVSKEEQRRRFLARLEEPQKNWKFEASDVAERGYWKEYMRAYEDALNETSRPWAPWYAIPADDKPYMRAVVADIIVRALDGLGLKYPRPSKAERERFDAIRKRLEAERD